LRTIHLLGLVVNFSSNGAKHSFCAIMKPSDCTEKTCAWSAYSEDQNLYRAIQPILALPQSKPVFASFQTNQGANESLSWQQDCQKFDNAYTSWSGSQLWK